MCSFPLYCRLTSLCTAAPVSASSSASTSASTLPSSSVTFLLSQLQSLRTALAADEDDKRRLQEDNSKLKYRINILLRALSEEEKKNASHGTAKQSSGDHTSSGGAVVQHSVSEVKQVLDKMTT